MAVLFTFNVLVLSSFLNKKNSAFYVLFLIFYLLFLFYSWDFYFNHYPKRALVLRSWQAGYKELSDYVKANYDSFDKFYITKKNGQPYIFLLFYLKYPPQKYQKESFLSEADQYGFGQVEKFDKFIFNFPDDKQLKNSVVVGYPDDFSDAEKSYLKGIKIGTETIFLVKEVK